MKSVKSQGLAIKNLRVSEGNNPERDSLAFEVKRLCLQRAGPKFDLPFIVGGGQASPPAAPSQPTMCLCLGLTTPQATLKINEGCVNVYENNGLAWIADERSRNLSENTATSEFLAGM
jgi:hypothetical protein